MKIALACKSILLEKSLGIFLREYIVPYKRCDFVISDAALTIDKPLFSISSTDAALAVPFSKSALFRALEKFYDSLGETQTSEETPCKKEYNLRDYEQFEANLDTLIEGFKKDILKLVRDFDEA